MVDLNVENGGQGLRVEPWRRQDVGPALSFE